MPFSSSSWPACSPSLLTGVSAPCHGGNEDGELGYVLEVTEALFHLGPQEAAGHPAEQQGRRQRATRGGAGGAGPRLGCAPWAAAQSTGHPGR